MFRATTKELHGDINEGYIPFSNGTEAEGWMSCNCNCCSRNYEVRNPSDDGLKVEFILQMIEEGRHCMGEYAMSLGFISGVVNRSVCEDIGATKFSHQKNGKFVYLPGQCQHFTDDDLENLDVPPEPYDPNQLMIPFSVFELFGFDDSEILVTKKAIYEL